MNQNMRLVTAWFLLATASIGLAQPPADEKVFLTPEQAAVDPDFPIQGEYLTPADAPRQRGLQVVALGGGIFRLAIFPGGLPGAGWDRTPPQIIDEEERSTVEDLIESLHFVKTARQSPTLGAAPPEGAIVLFDGTPGALHKHWEPGARLTADGLLLAGATSRERFQDYTVHLEFRTPYMPASRGQKRGNSGVYHQGRYETQILDSFGLKGLNNETGGIYEVRDPDLNVCLPPLSWQTYDVDFTAARYDQSGRKIVPARMTVRLNGVTVQSDVAVAAATRAAPVKDSSEPGPLHLQDHGNPVQFRNIWILPRDAEQEARRPRIAGYERFHALSENNVEGGLLLLGELGCVNCHAVGTNVKNQILTKRGPILSSVGSRVRPEWMLKFLADPHAVKPGTTMPDLLSGWEEAARDQAVLALTHFLASTGTLRNVNPDRKSVVAGEKLFHSIGCVACHAPQQGGQVPQATTVPLVDLPAKYSIPSLAQFLMDPHAVRDSGRMPSLHLEKAESEQLAHYLLRQGLETLPPNVRYTVYEGRWEKIPDFDQLPPVAQGVCVGFDLSVAKKTKNFGIRFEGYLVGTPKGAQVFALGSDDGARLSIDGEPVIDTDGIHPLSMVEKTGRFEERDVHTVRLDYFEAAGDEELVVLMGRQGSPLEDFASLLQLSPNADSGADDQKNAAPAARFRVDSRLVSQGRELFASLGCANCHELKQGDQPVRSTLAARPLEQVNPQAGCLSPHPVSAPQRPLPRYDLVARQRRDLSAVCDGHSDSPSPSSEQVIQRTMTAFNCYACHERQGQGGPEPGRNELFLSTQPEMGDEGRVPPPLNGVGDKLQDRWLQTVLDKGSRNRPYMLTRMPRFGTRNVGHLASAFIALDRHEEARPAEFEEPLHRVKSAGRQLVGNSGLACIKCHTFGDKQATGIQAISLTEMTSRIREDWFLRYLLDPARYRPGTRMPTGFPNGVAVVRDVYNGDPDRQVTAIWTYLTDGRQAGYPEGLVAKTIELIPESQPIIYRNFIEGLSPRGIAVGYPEKVNLAWDANELCLRLIWHDRFLDASLHWTGRGIGAQHPLGDHILPLEPVLPFAQLASRETPWPGTSPREQPGYQFLGYTLNKKGQPTFSYRTPLATITDFPEPVPRNEHEGTLRRTFTVTESPPGTDLYFRAAVGDTIRETADGYRVNNALTIRIQGGGAPFLRTLDGRQELIVPVPIGPAGTTTFTQEILW